MRTCVWPRQAHNVFSPSSMETCIKKTHTPSSTQQLLTEEDIAQGEAQEGSHFLNGMQNTWKPLLICTIDKGSNVGMPET